MPPKSDKEGALPCISKGLNYKVKSSSQIHKEKELESIFAEAFSWFNKNWLLQNLMIVISSLYSTNCYWKKRCHFDV